MIERQSPYLKHQHRLADVVAAIQVMGSYRYSGRTVKAWSKIMGEKPVSASNWLEVFEQHPEFFRADVGKTGNQSLVLRRAQSRTYDTRSGSLITMQQFFNLPAAQRKHISRLPLTSEQIVSLIDVAVKLHTQAIARRKELRWWVAMIIGLLSSFTGAFVASLIQA